MELTQFVLRSLGLTDYRLRLSKQRPELTPNIKGGRRHLAEGRGRHPRGPRRDAACLIDEAPGEAAFYGPKADFVVRDCIGRQWQLGTVQLDYVFPSGSAWTTPGPTICRTGR